MIPIAAAKEPADFDRRVRQPGLRAIAELCGKPPPTKRTAGQPFSKIATREADIPVDKLPPYWLSCLDELMTRYHEICAYSCFSHPSRHGRTVGRPLRGKVASLPARL